MSQQFPRGGAKKRVAGRQPRGHGVSFVYERLRDEILRLERPPGANLDENSIVAQYGVSRTPVREAIVRLAADDLVTVLPNRGARVAPLDVMDLTQYFEALELSHRAIQHWATLRHTPSDLREIKTCRRAYESAAESKDAIAMADTNMRFHQAIAASARNRHFESMASLLSAQGMRLSWIWYNSFAYDDPHEDITRTVDEHLCITRAMEQRHVKAAEQLATQHIEAFRDRLYAQLAGTLAASIPVVA